MVVKNVGNMNKKQATLEYAMFNCVVNNVSHNALT